jgi:hypothetical protein
MVRGGALARAGVELSDVVIESILNKVRVSLTKYQEAEQLSDPMSSHLVVAQKTESQ